MYEKFFTLWFSPCGDLKFYRCRWHYVLTLKAWTTSSIAKRSNEETHGKCTITNAVYSKLMQDKEENS
jgi:hypothetical protein